MNRMSFSFLREAAATLPWVFLALSLSACSRSTSETCSSGRICPPGLACSADGTACIDDHCGDGDQQEGEACDDGNLVNGDGCNSTCTSDESCGNGVKELAEVCDDGNTVNGDHCSFDCMHSAACGNSIIDEKEECDPPGNRDGYRCDETCRISFCGDGKPNEKEGEECDDGNTSDEDNCLNTCRLNTCGDGHLGPDEACDDGNQVTEIACPYGTKDCTICKNDCTAALTITGAYCGDGTQDSNEACDDGRANGTKTCQYGLKNCKVCNADCTAQEDGTGSYCGDGVKNEPFEHCDFGQSCGTCSSQCQFIPLNQAKGSITVTSPRDIEFGDVIVISDGSKVPVTFKFTSDCSSWPTQCKGNDKQPLCCIPLGGPEEEASEIASDIMGAVNKASSQGVNLFFVFATQENTSSAMVRLKHGSQASWGNQSIATNHAGPLTIKNMSGGVGHDCPDNSQCMSNDDCATTSRCKNNRCSPQ